MIALLALAGGVGAISRFVLDGLIRSRVRTSFPFATVVINVSGSLLLGFITGLVLFHAVPADWRLVLGTGFLGGYTTFSTASFETVRLIQLRRTGAAVANAIGTIVLAVLAAAAGVGVAWLV